MAFQFTCPHCGVVTRFRLDQIGQKGSCPSCKNAITIEPESTRPDRQPSYQDPNFDLKTTCEGGAVGCCIAGVITIAFLFLPMIFLLHAAVLTVLEAQGREPLSRQVLFYIALHLGLSCIYGAVCGAVLMGLCATFLRRSPALFAYARRGAAFGAVIPPGLVFVTLSWPLLVQSGLNDPPTAARMHYHWWLALALGTAGALTTMLVALLTARVLQKRGTASEKSP